jgi:ABC-type antimicrobial peptide transport system permease subunit
MLDLALSSVRFRVAGLAASFLSIFLGATIVMAFASMLDTRAGDGVDAASKETLFNMATIVGGWGLPIVVFAVASTLMLSVRQRGKEMALLRSVGATPTQVGRMLVGEAALLSVVAALAALAPALLAGALLVELLKDTDQVAPTVPYRFGPIAIVMGLGITFAAATIAALVTARRAAKMRTTESLLAASIDSPRMSRKRVVAACLFLALGLALAVVTATVMRGKGIDAMATAGQASIHAAIGLALLAPLLVRTVAGRLSRPLARAGASGYLTAQHVRQRAQQMASALMPIILFIATTGVLYMQSIENTAPPVVGTSTSAAEAENIETLNFVVVGMIAAFAAIMLINTAVATTNYRRQEFAQLRLAGATPPQVLRIVSLESIVVLVTGVVWGTVAALFTIVSYNLARTGSLVPDSTIAIYLGVLGAAAILTLASSLGPARRATRVPAVEAVAP